MGREAKIPVKRAITIGISVDHRRRNRCAESLQANVDGLKVYLSKLKIFPKKAGKKGCKAGDTSKSELQNVAQNTLKEIIPVPKPDLTIEASAYKQLKKARTNQKYDGIKRKKAAAATDE